MTTRTYDPNAIAATLDSGPAPETDSDEIDIDFGTAEENAGYSLIPPGVYPATILNAESRFSSNGDPMIVLSLRPDPPYNNRRLFDYYVLTDKARWKLRALLISLGFNPDDLIGTKRFSLKLLLDSEVLVTIKHEEWEGKTREKPAKVVGRQAFQPPPTRPDDTPFF